MTRALSWVRDHARDPGFKRALMLLVACEGMRWVLCDFAARLGQLEDAAQLRDDLKALEDVATLADLQALERTLDGRYGASVPGGGPAVPPGPAQGPLSDPGAPPEAP